MKRYPKTLSSGHNNTVIALSETEVGKMFQDDTRSDIGSEADKMKYANSVNNLIVQFIRLDLLPDNTELLVMERLYPLDYRAVEFEKRELYFDLFESELSQLHKSGFVHRDIKRPSNISGYAFDNVFMTDRGIRLIDVGVSALKSQVGEKIFHKFVEQELNELKEFKEYFLNR